MSRLNKVRATALNQRGAIQFIVLLILLLGIVGAVLLVTRGEPLKFLPKAGGGVSGPISPQTSYTLVPSKQNVVTGEEFTVDILVRSDIDAANLFAAKITFPPDLLEVTARQTNQAGAIPISNWVEQYLDHTNGLVSFVGGIPSPGYQTTADQSAPKLATIYFRAKVQGSAVINFEDSSAIYRNSDNLNILGLKNGITITIGTAGSPSPTSSPSPTPSMSPSPIPSPSATPLPGTGDGNNDGKINLADMSVLLTDFNKEQGFRVAVDMNGDGKINTFDFSLMRNLLIQKGVIRG